MAHYDFFISHHQEDAGAEASLLAETLWNQGYSVFLDVDTHQVGDLEGITKKALNASKGVIVLVGPDFAKRVDDSRDWVRLELEAAREAGKDVLPVVLPGAEESLRSLPDRLAWVGRTRWISFDRARVGAITEELRTAFAVRPRATGGPGTAYSRFGPRLVLVLVALVLLPLVCTTWWMERPVPQAPPPEAAFPWPPPRASAETMIPHNWLPTRGAARLGDVAERLEKALSVARYPRWSYSSLREANGFALVSQMEQIKADGTPSPDPARWSTKLPQVGELTLLEFIKALANAQPGYYRVIVFIVTNKPWPRKSEPPTGVEARKWFDHGFSWLPPSIAELPYGPDYRTTALVYEFKKVYQNTDATFLDPSATSADDHLRKAGISGPLSY